MTDAAIDPALTLVKQKLGGNKGIAEALSGITPQAVSQWKRIPHKRLQKIAELTGIPAPELRPDLAEALAA